ncbi:unnamed protein product [Lampetra planeri]
MEPLRVLELYSGIGGMHCALTESLIPAEVVAAVDINTTANQIYRHNFPHTPLWNKTIEGVTLDDFNKLSFDMLLMSPPCQPFTRLGLHGDVADARTKSFLYILDLLPRLSRPPRFILLENVKGFENSAARNRLVETLIKCGFTFQELMISPISVGIPNSRLRYYLIAQRSDQSDRSDQQCDRSEQSDQCAPPCPATHSAKEVLRHDFLYKRETENNLLRKMSQDCDSSVRQIKHFLEPLSQVDEDQHRLPAQTLLRYAAILDIVQPDSRRSICFTRGYRRYVEGTGSVLQSCTDTQLQCVFKDLDQRSEDEKLQQLQRLKLRYFTPREVANLMGFPAHFSFPKPVSVKQQYRVLGNSLNVLVVSKLLRLLVVPSAHWRNEEHFGMKLLTETGQRTAESDGAMFISK